MFWTSWSASTNRPNDDITYTNNWPHEPLVGNRPDRRDRGVDRREHHHAAGRHLRDGLVVCLAEARRSAEPSCPATDPLANWNATPSQRATLQILLGGLALILVQMLLGVVTAHYGVEGDGFYGIPLSRVAAVQRGADLARAARHVLDRHGVARRRACSSARW